MTRPLSIEHDRARAGYFEKGAHSTSRERTEGVRVELTRLALTALVQTSAASPFLPLSTALPSP